LTTTANRLTLHMLTETPFAIEYARAFAQARLAASIYDHRRVGRDITMKRLSELLAVFALALGVASGPACGADAAAQKHPDVVSAKVRPSGTDTFDFDVTVSSPYDTPQRYADAFRVSGKDGSVYGERELLHDHANEQPFTRDLHGVRIPRAVRVVVVQARDRKFGYGGRSLEVALPGR
jgi:hypothetical protein